MINFIKIHYIKITLTLLLFLGCFLRLYDINSVPVGPIGGEMEIYNSAHSIETTGHDIDGKLLPWTYEKFGRRNAPLYTVMDAITVKIFGQNTFALRSFAIICGLISIPLIYFLVLILFSKQDIAIVAALIQTIAPIYIHFSRIGWCVATEIPLIIASVWLLLLTFKNNQINCKFLYLSVLSFALTNYSYIAAIMYEILLGGFILILNYKKVIKEWKKVLIALSIWVTLSLPTFWEFLYENDTVSGTQKILTFKDGVNFQSIRIFIYNYFMHFNWSYLATDGYSQAGLTWLYVNGFGAFYWWVILLSIVGLGYCLINWNKLSSKLLLFWLLIYPLGGSLTNEGAPNATRTLAGLSVIVILSSLGFGVILNVVKKLPQLQKAIWILLIGLSLFSTAKFSDYYFNHSVHQNSNAWDSGSHDTFEVIKQNLAGMKRLCFSTNWLSTENLFNYYLYDSNINKFEGLNLPVCNLTQTILVTNKPLTKEYTDFKFIESVKDVDGGIQANIYVKN